MGTVAASILAADFANLGAQVAAVEPHVGIFHVDIMDGHFVPPIALGAVIVASLRPVTERTLHGHLMVEQPEGFFDELREAGLDVVSFHLEAVPEPGPAIAKARGAGLGVGLTLNLETPVEAVVPAGNVRVSCKPATGATQSQAVKVGAGETARVGFKLE